MECRGGDLELVAGVVTERPGLGREVASRGPGYFGNFRVASPVTR